MGLSGQPLIEQALGGKTTALQPDPASFPPRRRDPNMELPSEWIKTGERPGQSYRWPDYLEPYDPYILFEGRTERDARIQMALGFAVREAKWGRDRKYAVVFLTGGKPVTPLTEFLEADDFANTREMVAVIRGLDGGRRMYGPSDSLPDVYTQHFRTAAYGQRVEHPRVWNKIVVIAREDDYDSILNHALVQARRRGDL